MEVKISQFSGFCFGVKRADKIVRDANNIAELPVYTLGPLIHNPQVVEKLRESGINPIDSIDEISLPAVLVIRSHGIPKSEFIKLSSVKGLVLIDATCPFVKKAQRSAEKLHKDNRVVIILGESGHPEVLGLMDYTEGKAIVIEKLDEIEKLDKYERVGILAQTTQPRKKFRKMVRMIKEKLPESDIKVIDTVCEATQNRQQAALELAKSTQLMIIVGGRNSANTNRLAQICRDIGTTVYHIEERRELKKEWFEKIESVGISAGASTPMWLVEDIYRQIINYKE
jgi:(E)-4-hydroxy-3-methyl-but-2-enyl pyrophosphate reductase